MLILTTSELYSSLEMSSLPTGRPSRILMFQVKKDKRGISRVLSSYEFREHRENYKPWVILDFKILTNRFFILKFPYIIEILQLVRQFLVPYWKISKDRWDDNDYAFSFCTTAFMIRRSLKLVLNIMWNIFNNSIVFSLNFMLVL